MAKVPRPVICQVTLEAGVAWSGLLALFSKSCGSASAGCLEHRAGFGAGQVFSFFYGENPGPSPPLWEISCLSCLIVTTGQKSAFHSIVSSISKEAVLSPTLQKGPGRPLAILCLGRCACPHRRLQVSQSLGLASFQTGVRAVAPSSGPGALSWPKRVTKALGPPEEGAGLQSWQRGRPTGGLASGQGAPRRSLPAVASAGSSCSPGAGRRAGCGAPARTSSRPAAASRRAAASRGGRQRRACALARSRPGPWALPGGREVGTWAGEGPHTLPARRRRRRHLAARAPRDAGRRSGAGKRAGGCSRSRRGLLAPARGTPEAKGRQS